MKKNIMIIVEGLDGSGKNTLLEHIKKHIYSLIYKKEPKIINMRFPTFMDKVREDDLTDLDFPIFKNAYILKNPKTVYDYMLFQNACNFDMYKSLVDLSLEVRKSPFNIITFNRHIPTMYAYGLNVWKSIMKVPEACAMASTLKRLIPRSLTAYDDQIEFFLYGETEVLMERNKSDNKLAYDKDISVFEDIRENYIGYYEDSDYAPYYIDVTHKTEIEVANDAIVQIDKIFKTLGVLG